MASGYTKIQYGNITLYRCQTKQVDQSEVLDPSGTDLRFMQTTVSVEGRINGHDLGELWNFDQGEPTKYSMTSPGYGDNSNGLASIRHLNLRFQLPPRQRFVMLMATDENGNGGNPLILCNPAPPIMSPAGANGRPAAVNMNMSYCDMNNGPYCKSFVVTKVTGDELYTVEATFVICKVECDANGNVNNNTRGVLYNKWSVTDTLDANLRTSRVYMGQLALTSANLNMHQLRWLVFPPIMQIFRRDNIMVAASEDGLIMNWSVTDTEIAQAAPYPARKWSVRHTQSAQLANAGHSTIEVTLEADSNVNYADLIDLALYTITAKMFGVTPPNINVLVNGKPLAFWNQFFVSNLEFVDIIGDANIIMAKASVKKTMAAQNGAAVNGGIFALVGDIAEKFGVPFGPTDFTNSAYQRDARPPYNRAYSWGGVAGDSPPYQSPAASIIGIFVGYLQNPCDDFHQTANPITSGQDANTAYNQAMTDLNQTAPYIKNVPYSATIVPTLAPASIPNPFLASNALSNSNAYTFWQLENIYVNNSLNVQMPIASAPPRSGFNYSNTCEVVSLSQGIAKRIVRVKAERIGLEPQFPNQWNIPSAPAISYSQPPVLQAFLKSKIRACTPTVGCFGQTLFRAEANYILALNRMPNPGEQLALGNDVWSNIGVQNSSSTGALTNSNWNNLS